MRATSSSRRPRSECGWGATAFMTSASAAPTGRCWPSCEVTAGRCGRTPPARTRLPDNYANGLRAPAGSGRVQSPPSPRPAVLSRHTGHHRAAGRVALAGQHATPADVMLLQRAGPLECRPVPSSRGASPPQVPQTPPRPCTPRNRSSSARQPPPRPRSPEAAYKAISATGTPESFPHLEHQARSALAAGWPPAQGGTSPMASTAATRFVQRARQVVPGGQHNLLIGREDGRPDPGPGGRNRPRGDGTGQSQSLSRRTAITEGEQWPKPAVSVG